MSSSQSAASSEGVPVVHAVTTSKGIQRLPSSIIRLVLGHLPQEDLFSLYSAGLVREILSALPDRVRIPRELMVEMLRYELKIPAPTNAQLVIVSHMCRDCGIYLAEPRMLVCTGCLYPCSDCNTIGVPTVKVPLCINSLRYSHREPVQPIHPGQREDEAFDINADEDPEFESVEDGINCCWKNICRDGCLFTCDALITSAPTATSSTELTPTAMKCDKEHFSPVDAYMATVFSTHFSQDGGHLYYCTDCADAQPKNVHLESARWWEMHCNKCNLDRCKGGDECPGCCEDCGSTAKKLRWVPACSKTRAMWRPEMKIWEFPVGCHWKRVCWGSCNWMCIVCGDDVERRGIWDPSGLRDVYNDQDLDDDSVQKVPSVWKQVANAEDDTPLYVCHYCSRTVPSDQLVRVHLWHDECRTAQQMWSNIRHKLKAVLELRGVAH
jgi:hypothetical protein